MLAPVAGTLLNPPATLGVRPRRPRAFRTNAMSRNDSGSQTDARPVECTISEERRPERAAWVREQFLPHLEAVDYVENGVEMTFEAGDAAHETVAGFVRREAECCSFARYRIDYAPPETLALTVTGPEGTRDLYERGFEEEFDDALDAADVSLPE